eukprot:TRINITY_DN18352_c0_g1_i10.p1 TRINITY_DN18352_c0_g1~~TRINITY_DN18352_c0_g1_i10.p1  ORF type:complete len:199 (-),score=55.41 TRINITY_DN18352_c0_g1_i10:19-615(-)
MIGDRPTSKPKKAPKSDTTAKQTVDPEPEKKKKKQKKPKKPVAQSVAQKAEDDDPFADTEVPQMTPTTTEPSRPGHKKATIMSAFDDDGDSRDGEVDLLTDVFSTSTSTSAPTKKEKDKTESWDPFSDSDKSKTQVKATTTAPKSDDDPWSTGLADLSLGSKGGSTKGPAQNGAKSMAEIGRAVQQECRDRSRMPSSA